MKLIKLENFDIILVEVIEMQNVVCKFNNCGFCSSNGFCLNRLVVINEQGLCQYLTRAGWDRKVQKWEKQNYFPKEWLEIYQGSSQVQEQKQSD